MLHANRMGISVGPYVKTRPKSNEEAKKAGQNLAQTVRFGAELLIAGVGDENIDGSGVKEAQKAKSDI